MMKIEIEEEELRKVSKNITIRLNLLDYLQIKREKINLRELIERGLRESCTVGEQNND